MSLSKFFILCVLHRGPLHGYEIAREVSALTHGCCTPAEGTIYPVLRQYEQGGYVTVQNETVSGRQRRVYSLTDKGREAFRVAVAAWMDVTECLLECRNVLDGESMPDALRAG
ncbi:PadR family transcriptional regulator [Spiribacter halobius]|uniref:PadR family transcriptional regulator n=2 Tax=Sediminicurvatus halobius TaxID=2182432 RepID=A0A2U2MYQ6_9GAMM|nr:PadR family transcriptional regulator [Spiribacter halobius]